MAEKETKPNPGDLSGDGLGDAAGNDCCGDTGAEVETENGQLQAELAQARAEVSELNDRLLRSAADYENYKRRMQREKEDLMVFANQKLILSLLPALDNLERALATPQSAGDEKLRQGVELTARSFRDALTREGLTPIEAVGQHFDPNLHEAVMTVESPDHEDGVIVAEFQKGYKLGERVIRPSMVQVCKRD
ncbi:MAG: nucleotide exchange factor GrpE [Mycobacterium leprae]